MELYFTINMSNSFNIDLVPFKVSCGITKKIKEEEVMKTVGIILTLCALQVCE